MVKAIIPCAGYGTRQNMQIHEAKEMLPDPAHGFERIIDYSLDICKRHNLEPLIITRQEKTEFNNYINQLGVNHLIINPSGEWPRTVLASIDNWSEDNILILPDTRFQPESIIDDLKLGLALGNNAVFAMHEIPDPDKWCIIKNNIIYEKPICFDGPQMAWGLIGFKKHYGEELFNNIHKLELSNCGFVGLDSFKDITR